VLAVVPLLLLAATYAVATVDIRNHDGKVLRGVTLGQVDVGSMSADELDGEFDRINDLVAASDVYIVTPEAAYQIEAGELGLQLDRSKTRAALLAAGREGTNAVRPLGWLRALFAGRTVDPVLELDSNAAEGGLFAASKTISVQPGEPTLVLDASGRLELLPGTPGSILDVRQLLNDLGRSLPSEAGQEIFVDGVTTTESGINVDIQSLVDRINVFTEGGVEFVVNDTTVRARRDEFNSWVRLDLTNDRPAANLDADQMYRWINAAAGIAEENIDTRALIVEGDQIRLPEANAVQCCVAAENIRVLQVVLGGTNTIELELLFNDVAPLAELGVSELVGEFTTEHPAGEDRVVNIQRMADIVRGAVIEPGETFSLNGYVGERTAAKGFVPAGVIYDGVFDEDVGGGVSQFATTLFNAGFFGGLDFVQYQPHSIYIDRYPFGREATVNWPSVDLKLRNPTDFPVLIWTEYTDDSITVKLFGTATVSGLQTDQTVEPQNECTRVRTERTRTWADGRVETDTVGATYQPEEGRDCDGNSTLPLPECLDDEGLVDTNDDGLPDDCLPLEVICPFETEPIDDDSDGLTDYCFAEDCPENTEAVDTGNGTLYDCLPLEDARLTPEVEDAPSEDPAEG